MTEEGRIKKEITNFLETFPPQKLFFFLHVYSKDSISSKNRPRGIADIIAIYLGKPVFFEVKTKIGKESSDQKIFAERVMKAGGYYYVVRCVADVISALEEIQPKFVGYKSVDEALKSIP